MGTRAWAVSLWVGVWMLSATARAEEFHVDPARGSIDNDGSAQSPWSTLEEVVAAGKLGSAVQAGDTVWLESGYHGGLDLRDGDFSPALTLEAAPGADARLSRARFSGASGVTLRGVSISPSHAPSYEGGTMVTIDDASARIVVEGCELFSEDDASGWTASDWIDHAVNGFQVSGPDAVVRDNLVRNVRFGISVDGLRALIDHNTVDGFSADGMRGLGDDETFQYNVVKNVYVDGDLDDNHDDGFQSWSVGPDGVGTGEVRGMVLRGNVILNYEDPNQPFRATLQGIGCFDGTFVDWVVENNVVITDHWHGITLLGARDSRVVNNTVIDVNDETPGPPWISIDAHKDGTPPEGCVVRNNLATDYANADTVTADHNRVIDDASALFVDVAAHDLHLRDDAVDAIDQGVADLAPALDADGIARPQGAAVDLGAFEWHEPGVEPMLDAGAGSAGMQASGAGTGGGPAGGGSGGAGTGGAGSGAAGANGGAADAGLAGAEAAGASSGLADAGPACPDGSDACEDEGCSCRLPGGGARRAARGWMAALAALALAGLRRGRRRGAYREEYRRRR